MPTIKSSSAALLCLAVLSCKTTGPIEAERNIAVDANREKNLDSMNPVVDSSVVRGFASAAQATEGDEKLLLPFLPALLKPKGPKDLQAIAGDSIEENLWNLSEAYFNTKKTKEAEAGCLNFLRIKHGSFVSFPSLFGFKFAYRIDQKPCFKDPAEGAPVRVVADEKFYKYRSCPGLDVSKIKTTRDAFLFREKCQGGSYQVQKWSQEKAESKVEDVVKSATITKTFAQQQADGMPCRMERKDAGFRYLEPCLLTLLETNEVGTKITSRLFAQLTLHETGWVTQASSSYPKSGVAKVEINNWQGTIFFESTGSAPTYIISDDKETRRGSLIALNR